MKSNFERCMQVVAKWEGGWSDHPHDNGGATMYGITIGTLSAWRGRPVSKAEVKALTKDEALQIYRAWYWQPVRGDDLPAGVDLVAFDPAVNSGPSRGAKWLQAAVGVAQDGMVGPATVKAAQSADPVRTINHACDVRLSWLRGLNDWPHFGKGWTNRVEDVRAQAILMARDQEVAKKASLPSFLRGICSKVKGEER